VFKITPSGKLTTLYSFCGQANCPDSAGPDGTLIQAADGDFYGPTLGGGNNSYGTVFKITASGKLTTLYSFAGYPTDGSGPSTLVQAANGNFYGATYNSGMHGCGTVFELTPTGTLTTLHSFDHTDGCNSFAGLLQATNGKFYGTPYFGGSNSCSMGCGTVFSLGVGLPPFVEALPYSGKVGKNIKILGQGLTGTTAVSFNRTAASFTVKSDTYLVATIPNGATAGFVTVATPSGTLTSNRQFRVTP
jgi:uncharacterized repeat protein (TIGR03803 family)